MEIKVVGVILFTAAIVAVLWANALEETYGDDENE